MSTTTHTLTGSDLEALLARVPTELGPDATIVAANKLRTGGIGGFFAKEAYEVVVEAPEALQTEAADATPAPAPTPAPVPAAPRMSTEGVGFAGVLDRLVRDAGLADQPPRAVGPQLAEAPNPTAHDHRSPVEVADEEPEADEEPFQVLAPTQLGRPMVVPAPAPVPVLRPAPATTAPVARPTAPAAPVLDRRWLTQVGVPEALADQLPVGALEPIVALFHLLQHVTPVEDLPTAPGSVIAVVGRRHEALDLSADLADELGVDRDEVLVAASTYGDDPVPEERRLASIDAALERRRTWRRRRIPTIVVVDAPVGVQPSPWAQRLLDAVEPAMVWGVVDASRKAEDVRVWAHRLGGLDALAVHGLQDTMSPASVLGVGVPVGRLDGQAATPGRWTALLSERFELVA